MQVGEEGEGEEKITLMNLDPNENHSRII